MPREVAAAYSVSPQGYAPSERLAYGLMLLSPALFSTNMLVAKATADFMPPIALAFWRWVATLLLVLLVVRGRLWRSRFDLASEWRDLLLLGALGMAVCGAFVYIGAHTTSGTNIGIIYAASPVVIVIFGWLVYGEAMSVRQTVGVAVALIGVLVVIARADLEVLLGLSFTVGDLWIVVSASAWGVYSVLLRHRPSGMGLNERFAGIVGGGLIVMLPFTIAEGLSGYLPPFEWSTLGWIALLAIVASFGSYQVYALVQRSLGANRAGLILYLNPLYTALLAWALLGERLEFYHLLGALLILPGLWLATHR